MHNCTGSAYASCGTDVMPASCRLSAVGGSTPSSLLTRSGRSLDSWSCPNCLVTNRRSSTFTAESGKTPTAKATKGPMDGFTSELIA